MKIRRFRPARFVVKVVSLIKTHTTVFLATIALLLASLVGFSGYRLLQRYQVKPQDLLSFFGQPVENLESTNGFTNFLILGIRGEGHDSPNLSDTILIFSYNHDSRTTTVISVPRDLWVPSMRAKINTAYHYGEEASPGAGFKLASAAILEDLGLPINYIAVINFSLFEQAVNLVGGVDINVDPGFTDTEFPIPGLENALPISSRYETITFPTGLNHFDGQTALKYVRSRHAVGDEGTDFSRSRRQQQVITALREKVLTPSFMLDRTKVQNLLNIVSSNLVTNIPPKIFPTLAKIALDSQSQTINNISLSTTPDKDGITILYHPSTSKFNGEWVLMPKDNNWNALKLYLKNQLLPPPPSP